MANSPVPSQRMFLRGRTTPEQNTADDEAKQTAILNDPNTPPALKQFLRVRATLPKGENIPHELITQPNGPQGTTTDANYMLNGKPIVAQRKAGRLAYQGQDVTDQVTPYVPPPDAANARQAATIAAQVATQSRAQDFSEAQAGRAELTNKVEQPYLDAREKADTLRSTVQAAKGGNMVAGSLQPLLATLGVTTMEGVKRINSVEIAQVAGAGSLLERIKGAIGKQTEGQPLSEKVQNDITQLANVLEQSARKKYLEGHATTTKRYKLANETPLPEPPSTPAPAPRQIRYDMNGRPLG